MNNMSNIINKEKIDNFHKLWEDLIYGKSGYEEEELLSFMESNKDYFLDKLCKDGKAMYLILLERLRFVDKWDCCITDETIKNFEYLELRMRRR